MRARSCPVIKSNAVSSPEVAFGDVGNSGCSRTLSGAGILEFANRAPMRVN
ncbi:MAG: hypothetical protein KGI87_03920 [Burkholderiales bacterium]|nr:hypothetical protein [Burkholderiales bacterium]MDE2296671.1 hypothetical protein [Burkholderiales bacterium]